VGERIIDGSERSESREWREPDEHLARGRGVAYRYVLRLAQPDDVAIVVRVLADVAIPLRYLLLMPSASRDEYAAYVGLARADVLDLPVRLAWHGVRIARGEELEGSAER
jgi:hypothetical protein